MTDDEDILASAEERRAAGDAVAAAEMYDKLLGTPLAGRANLALGTLYLERDLLEKAEGYLRAALSDPEVEADALYGLGVLEQRRGNLDAARTRLRACLGLVPQHPLAVKVLKRIEQPVDSRTSKEKPPSAPADAVLEPQPLPSPIANPATTATVGAAQLAPTVAEVLDNKELTDAELRRSPGELKWHRHPVWWSPPGVARGIVLIAVLFGALWGLEAIFGSTGSPVLDTWSRQLNRAVWAAWPPVLSTAMIWIILRWWTTHYSIYERRIEVRSGVLFRHHRGIWLHEVERPVFFTQNPWQALTRTGDIVIESEKLPTPVKVSFLKRQQPANWGQLRLAGFGITQMCDDATNFLTQQILRERRALLDKFVSR